MRNLIQKIGRGIALTAALAGGARAFANPSVNDLRALEDYAKQHGTAYDYTENGINKGPLYVVKNGDYTLEVNGDFITLIKDGDKTYMLHDMGKDGLPEAVISAEGRLTKLQKDLLEQNLGLGGDTLEVEIGTADLDKTLDKNGEQKAYNERKETYVSPNGEVLFGDFKDEQSLILTGSNAESLKQSMGSFYEKFVNAFKKTLGLSN